MPLDAIFLAAVRDELAEQVIEMKIDRVSQPEKDIVILSLRGSGGNCKLLISSGTGDGRVHLTDHQFDNPKTPPMFCMLLRKHLLGARIISIVQPEGERVIVITLNAPDALGFFSEKHLVIELIGRMSNIILLDENNIIIDCLRRIGGELSERRIVLPGLLYREPPLQEGKRNPMRITEEEWDAAFPTGNEIPVDKWLISTFSALSPLICRELSWQAYGATDYMIRKINDNGAALKTAFFHLIEQVKSKSSMPWLLIDDEKTPKDFSYTKINQYENILVPVQMECFSALLDTYFTKKAQIERVRQRAASLTKTMKNARDRLVRKLALQKEEHFKTKDRDKLRECGDIITANMHLMKKGNKELVAQDFYDPDNKMRTISLDALKTPQQNAAGYYKAYSKAKNAEKYLADLIAAGESELKYLENVLEQIFLAQTEQDLESIREELGETGYIKITKNRKDRKTETSPMRFISSSGMVIHAGRNNIQNDQITMKNASKSDIWLHTQRIHGAHVVISSEGDMPDEETLVEAASIAAHFSSARNGSKVPVDYTYVKHVKKPTGARPGMVVYTDYKTIIANPDEDLVNRLRQS